MKCSGGEHENMIQLLIEIEWNMELINDNLELINADKTNVVSRHLKGTEAEWFSIIQDKTRACEPHFKRYWNEEIKRKVWYN